MNIISAIYNQLQKHHVTKQASRFIIVGGGSTFISYSTFLICLRLLNFHYLISNVCGFILSIGFSYYCNQRWTFDSKESKKFHHYFLFYLCSLGLSSIILQVFVEYIGIIPEIANILTIALMTFVNFFGIKLLIFKK